MKYIISVAKGFKASSFESNSRNARRHLIENEADTVIVYRNRAYTPVSIATRVDGAICVGTYSK